MSALHSTRANGCLRVADSRVMDVLEGYLAELEQGGRPDPDALLARHPDMAAELGEYLASLELLHRAAVEENEPAPAGETLVGGTVGDYRIVREVGRGGMGVVYEAMQISLGRRVALKVLPFAAALDARQLQRFRNEVHAAAQLHHPNIVPVYAVGSERSIHFYAMQFIDGLTLADVFDRLRREAGLEPGQAAPGPEEMKEWAAAASTAVVPAGAEAAGDGAGDGPARTGSSGRRSGKTRRHVQTVVRLIVQAAQALEYAHQQGVVHRDVKPANLLVDARGSLWITDFGLARCRGEDRLTMTGDLVGTLRYMSPEQALAKRFLVDHRTDVYSLGLTLYELLTLEPAFTGEDMQELLRQIAFEEPKPVRKVDAALPVDLETIVLKATAKEPEARYATAQEFADDLERFLRDEPIRARRPSIRERLTKWAWRHRRGVAVFGLLLCLGLVVSMILAFRFSQQGDALRQALNDAQEKSRLANEKAEEALRLRMRAEQNFSRAREGFTQLIRVLEEPRWAGIPKIAEVRQAHAAECLQILQTFVSNGSRDPAIRAETGRAYLMLGHVYGIRRNMGQVEASYRKAVETIQGVVDDVPYDTIFLHDLASACNVLGLFLHSKGDRAGAAMEFKRAEAAFTRCISCPLVMTYAQNNFAWFLLTCPQEDLRDPQRALGFANQALKLSAGQDGTIWNTVGVARYRTGDHKGAIEALTQSMNLRKGGDGFDWYYLAMAHWKLGQKDEAMTWYKKAEAEVYRNSVNFEPLSPYRNEARAVLGLPLLPQQTSPPSG